ncbi:DNA primase [Sphingomonas piscis]|uniref:DNA primase n=1 Tax=Sphingomonas piscis TaxID=2714943 RepID=A0A6G7YLM0_9SPHN|nr:DNA primase [Sphingomonas piscis]QIK77640.1 DNA primase [Sphingomonas piscis]
MTLSPAFLDELRARTLLSAVIAPSVKLTKAGREWKACCPFHNEKTPSFTVNDEKHFYHCFGCGAHGDAIRFLTDARGMPFMDAVKELAGKAGLEVPAPDPRSRERAERAASLTDVMASVQSWYADQLQGSEGGEARDYLKKRGINADQVKRFGIGFAPDGRTKLKNALHSLGEEALVETGMLIKPEDGGAAYDRFRGRLMIPIKDVRGRVIGFGGRIIGQGEPKYLNSPETSLFDKGRTLYNLDRAGPASRAANRLIVVEGYMDVIGLDRAGIGEVVAPNGTAVTESQLERMWRLEPSPILCFDGDNAGQKAAIRAATRALPHLGPERTLRFAELPAGQDPDDLVKSGGREVFEEVIARAEPLSDRLYRHEAAAQPLTTPEARAGLRQRLLAHASAIGDQALARLYRDEWLSRFDAEVGRRAPATQRFTPQRRGSFVKGRFVPPEPPLSDTARGISSTGIDGRTARALLLGFAHFPQLLADHAEQLATLPIADPKAAAARNELIAKAFSGAALDREELTPIFAMLGAKGGTPSRNVISFSFTRPDSDPARASADLAAAVEALAAGEQVDRALALATERFKADCTEEAYGEQQRLIEAKRKLNERLASLAGTD